MKNKCARLLTAAVVRLMVVMVLSLSGCGKKNDVENGTVDGTEQTDTATDTDAAENMADTPDDADKAASENSDSSDPEAPSFAALQYVDFTFSSGAGAWATQLNIRPDGSFSGEYWDMDMGSSGDGYPNGTQYGNTFTGKFTDLQKVNDYTWAMKLGEINYTYEVGKEEILDQILYSYTEAYGLDGADEVDIYLPGAPVDQLPEEFLQWACSNYDRLEAEENGLPCYGLYNVEGAEGFSGYDFIDTAVEYVENAAKADQEIVRSLQEDPSLTQMDMNVKSKERYDNWDAALNLVWYQLKMKGVLKDEDMEQLLTEQREWIKEKEEAAQKAGEGSEGGSIWACLVNDKAAELTKERTYVLLNILLEAAGRETVTME